MSVVEHTETGMGLTADAFVHFFEIRLVAAPSQPSIYFTDGPTRTWQGKEYEEAPVRLTGFSRTADEERSRPTLQILDRANLLIEFAFSGYIERARVTRKRVLRTHAEANIDISDTHMWYVSRVKEVITGQAMSVELRSLSDGPLQLIPARKYIPPEFPFVTL